MCREPDTARRADDQWFAHDFLKSPKMGSYRWLRQMQMLRGSRNLSTLRNGEERSEKSQVEVVWVHISRSK